MKSSSAVEPKKRNKEIGFHAKFRVSPDIIQFMNLEHLECGEMVSFSFMIRFFMTYFKLGGMISGPNINLSPTMRELFREELELKGIDPSSMKYTEFPKLIQHKRAKGRLIPVFGGSRGPGSIAKSENFEALSDTILSISKSLGSISKRDDNYGQLVLDMRTAWICLGLPGWAEIVAQTVKIKVYGGDDDPECCICMDKVKNQVFFPCKHMCCCENCSSSVMRIQKKCPICREVIIRSQVFDLEKHERVE